MQKDIDTIIPILRKTCFVWLDIKMKTGLLGTFAFWGGVYNYKAILGLFLSLSLSFYGGYEFQKTKYCIEHILVRVKNHARRANLANSLRIVFENRLVT